MPSTASRTAHHRKRDATNKLAAHRLSVLELARELGNVTEACRRRGLDRTRLLRVEATLPNPRLRRPQGPAAHPQEPSANHTARDRPAPSRNWPSNTRLTAATGSKPSWHSKDAASRRSPSRRFSTTTAWAPAMTAGWPWKRPMPAARSNSAPNRRPFSEKANPCFRERHVESTAHRRVALCRHLLRGHPQGHR